MLKVQRTANGKVVFAVSGRLEADSLSDLAALLAQEPLRSEERRVGKECVP